MDSRTITVNPDTGEIAFNLNGHQQTAKATWKAISDIETSLGYGIVPLVMRIQSKNYGLKEASVILYHGILAAKPAVQPAFEAVVEQVFKAGILSQDIIDVITKFCELALTGGRPEGESDQAVHPEMKNQTESPSAA